ncbi:hypothetical protein E4U43_003244 [Claviceps pusilla]|uniref:HNH nuclease domain-containing protein n=1 Tax=Claviceps pusilla TaxID=123648 RepID=A0A9P7SVI5_9HYPO|nr:hypothetical protein E4U43_003244 [Claviceps pusilla]
MANAAITPRLRTLGWNVHVLCGPERDQFAGLFHPPGSNSLTYRDIVNELRLCFDIPVDSGVENEDTANSWHDIAFGYELVTTSSSLQPVEGDTSLNPTTSKQFLSGQDLCAFICIPACDHSSDHQQPNGIRLHAVRHTECEIGHSEPISVHLQQGCAKHLPNPLLRRDERYLPPGKASSDPHFAHLPYRKTIRPASGSRSPSKRSASGSATPSHESRSFSEAGAGEDVANMVAPPAVQIPIEQARRIMAAFRTACLASSARCAVSGKGRPWYTIPAVGPGIQACHIVPQQHYNVYPVPSYYGESQHDPQRLHEAWTRTWSGDNGLALFSHFHDFFDNRLFSIHPETLKIRVFVPYDVLLEYHGSIAKLPHCVDRNALRHHYDMCCIENMAAKRLLSDAYFPGTSSRSGISGPISQFESECPTPSLTGPSNIASSSSKDGPGDPEKRPRQGPDELADSIDQSPKQIELSTSVDSVISGSYSPPKDRLPNRTQKEECRGRKRRRISSGDNAAFYHDRGDRSVGASHSGYITPANHESFLAHVNSKLEKTVTPESNSFFDYQLGNVGLY